MRIHYLTRIWGDFGEISYERENVDWPTSGTFVYYVPREGHWYLDGEEISEKHALALLYPPGGET